MQGRTKKKIVISEFMDPGAVSALRSAPSLQALSRLGVGLDNIDVELCRRSGLVVVPAVGANALAVAEHVVSVSMLLLRGFLFFSAAVADGRWPRAQLSSGSESAGKTLGIVGFGSVGQAVGQVARAVGMRVIAYDPMLDPTDAAWRMAERHAHCRVCGVCEGRTPEVWRHREVSKDPALSRCAPHMHPHYRPPGPGTWCNSVFHVVPHRSTRYRGRRRNPTNQKDEPSK